MAKQEQNNQLSIGKIITGILSGISLLSVGIGVGIYLDNINSKIEISNIRMEYQEKLTKEITDKTAIITDLKNENLLLRIKLEKK